MMVKLLSGKILNTPQDSIPQKSTSRGQGRYKIPSTSAKGKSSDKHIYLLDIFHAYVHARICLIILVSKCECMEK